MATVDMIKLDGLPMEVTFKRIKHLHLKVYPPEGRVVISAPINMSLAAVRNLLLSKLDWIHSKRAKIIAQPQVRPEILHQQRQKREQQRQQLKAEVERLVQHWQPIMQVSVQKVTLRQMKTKWGSCTPSRGTLRINLVLAERSLQALEMVVVHEMAHLLESSHNARFYALMDRFLPHWRVSQRELEKG